VSKALQDDKQWRRKADREQIESMQRAEEIERLRA
jgi:hypothetical protein